MKRFSHQGAAWKKKLCIALALSLLTGQACFLQGEASSPEWTEDGSDPEAELPEDETGIPNTENSETEIQDTESTETEDTETPETDNQDSEAETFPSEDTEPDIQRPEDARIETLEADSLQDIPSVEESSEIKEFTCLQIPEKLEIVINPWEMDGKEQIYSEVFTVKNAGDMPGILTLTFTCGEKAEDRVMIQKTREGLHVSGEKQLYMKAMLGNGEEYIFTEEGVQCQAKLQPGEELSLWFEGEVNENAEEPWQDGDLKIRGRYSWEETEIQPSEPEKENEEKDSLEEE